MILECISPHFVPNYLILTLLRNTYKTFIQQKWPKLTTEKKTCENSGATHKNDLISLILSLIIILNGSNNQVRNFESIFSLIVLNNHYKCHSREKLKNVLVRKSGRKSYYFSPILAKISSSRISYYFQLLKLVVVEFPTIFSF